MGEAVVTGAVREPVPTGGVDRTQAPAAPDEARPAADVEAAAAPAPDGDLRPAGGP
ncbi:hypothetical protein QJS66_22545 [Kocuria rhizophila]|nr:hypothetical protein QJS66_22545 [Kocuria rhizophila]